MAENIKALRGCTNALREINEMIWYISPRTQEKWQRSGMAFPRTMICGQFCWETGGKPAQQGELQFLWPCSRRGALEGQKGCQCGWSPVREGMEGTKDSAVVGRSHDAVSFSLKELWGARERTESRECHDLIICSNFSLTALCGKYHKWAGHKAKQGDRFEPSCSSPLGMAVA